MNKKRKTINGFEVYKKFGLTGIIMLDEPREHRAYGADLKRCKKYGLPPFKRVDNYYRVVWEPTRPNKSRKFDVEQNPG